MTRDLFDFVPPAQPQEQSLGAGATLLRGFALAQSAQVLEAVAEVVRQSPFRHMITPGGFRMSVAMTNCGSAGWVTDRTGYRYDGFDPTTQARWPAMPVALSDLATRAAARGGFVEFLPDACLINRYEPGTRLSLHQDKNERDLGAPVVSVSLGLQAVFLFGGPRREDRTRAIPLAHGDVVVWGGPSRLWYHGVRPLQDGEHPELGRQRINLTFRKAL
ncbi:MAG: oxidative demethylase [Gammaproteobacteria bacterium]|jgi:alkylated DNA repair protein (DNA oxidative demethylase)|nr:oxidative demethylase [Gammaproteobacteria bacterium]